VRLNLVIKTLILSLIFTSNLWAAHKPSKFQISCKVELLGGGGSHKKVFHALSPEFVGVEIVSDSKAELKFGPYVLMSEIYNINESPVAHPELHMEIFKLPSKPVAVKGLPERIFQANLKGIDWNDFKRPYTLSGYQFMTIELEKIKYTRLDYSCTVDKKRS
jgi:hypothetical protein